MGMNKLFCQAAVSLCTLLWPLAAIAQAQMVSATPAGAVSLAGGRMGFDANGTGWASLVALDAMVSVGGRWLLVGGRGSYSAIQEQFQAGRTQLGFTEFQAQAQLPIGVLRPYVGVGAGAMAFLTRAGSRERVSGIASLAGGLRVAVTRQVGVGIEARIRQWHQTAERGNVEVTMSVARFLGK